MISQGSRVAESTGVTKHSASTLPLKNTCGGHEKHGSITHMKKETDCSMGMRRVAFGIHDMPAISISTLPHFSKPPPDL
jgi:hypothetical protein